MTALRAGARHVTAVERWLYLSATAHDALTANGFDRRAFDVVYKRPTDLALLRDVPVVCNLLIADIMDEGASLSFDVWYHSQTGAHLEQRCWYYCAASTRLLTALLLAWYCVRMKFCLMCSTWTAALRRVEAALIQLCHKKTDVTCSRSSINVQGC